MRMTAPLSARQKKDALNQVDHEYPQKVGERSKVLLWTTATSADLQTRNMACEARALLILVFIKDVSL